MLPMPSVSLSEPCEIANNGSREILCDLSGSNGSAHFIGHFGKCHSTPFTNLEYLGSTKPLSWMLHGVEQRKKLAGTIHIALGLSSLLPTRSAKCTICDDNA